MTTLLGITLRLLVKYHHNFIELNPKEETLFANRGTCFKAQGKFKHAKADYDKALELNPKNTKNIKRKANLMIVHGHLGDAVELLTKCINLEPKDGSHQTDINNVKTLLHDSDRVHEFWNNGDYKRCEEISEKILKEASEYTTIKYIYVKSLLANVKLDEAEEFLNKKVTAEEKVHNEDFEYLTVQASYYQGK